LNKSSKDLFCLSISTHLKKPHLIPGTEQSLLQDIAKHVCVYVHMQSRNCDGIPLGIPNGILTCTFFDEKSKLLKE